MIERPGRLHRLALVAVSCALLIMGCSTKEEKTASFIAAGDRLLAAEDPVRAVLEYKNALQMDPKSTSATHGLGKAYLQQQEYQQAYNAFKSALELNPDLDESRIELAWLLAMGRQGEPALLEVAQLRNPGNFQSRVDLIKARALISIERPGEVVELLAQVRDGARNKEVQALLLLAHQLLGESEQMHQAAARWTELDPADPTPYLLLAREALEHGRKTQALEHLERMAKTNSEPSTALLRAQLLDRWGFREEAETAFENLPSLPETMLARADFWLRAGNRQRALITLENLVAAHPRSISAVVMLAQLYGAENDPEKANQLLDSTLKLDVKKSEREQLRLARAGLLAQRADWEAASKLCNEVLAENQGNMDAHLLLGKVLLSTRKPADAEIHLNQVAAARPGDEQVQLLLVRSQIFSGKEALAADTLKRTIEASPESTRLRLELVSYYLGKGDPDQAARVFDQGLQKQPGSIGLLKAAGEFEADRKDFAKAERSFQKIIELRPELALGYLQMGRLMIARDNLPEATAWFKKAMERGDGWEAAVPALAHIYLLRKEHDQARTLVQQETEKHPDSPLAWLFRGQVLQAMEELSEAETAYLRAVELDPQWLHPYRGLAEILLRQGKIEEAIARFEGVAQSQPSVPIRIHLATLYEIAERSDNAIRVLQELIKEETHSPALMNNLAYLYAEHRVGEADLVEAGKLVAQALAREPENPTFLDTAAWVAYKQGDFDTAWKYIQDALIRDPKAGVHNLHAAIILHARGEKEQAIERLDASLTTRLDLKSRKLAENLKQEWPRS